MVGVPSPCPTGALRHVCIALAALAPSLAAQHVSKKAGGDPRADIVQQAVAELADPARALDAQRRLFHLGAFAVEPLRAHLHRDEVNADARGRIVFVLGKLGHVAAPALPELRDALRSGDGALMANASWALTRVMPFVDPELFTAVVADLRRIPPELQNDLRLTTLRLVLWSRPVPDAQALRQSLAQNDGLVAGTSTWVRVLAWSLDDLPAYADLLRKPLDERMQRDVVSWQGAQPGWAGTPDIAEAWLAVTKQPLDGNVARALLDHWDPDERLRAISWLRANGAALPFRERADLVGRLWDDEPQVAIAAANALAAWGSAGLVGLAPLRSRQQTLADPAVAAACGAAAQTIAADESLAGADRAFVAAIDAALRAGPAPTSVPKATPAGRQLAAEVLFLGQWQAPDACARLLHVVETAGAIGDDPVRSVAGWLCHREVPTLDCALAWLARRGAAPRTATQVNFTWLARHQIAVDARAAATEAMAWITTSGAGAGELRAMCDDDNLRVAARALCALLAEPAGTPLPAAARLQALVSLDRSRVILRVGAQDNGIAIGNNVSAPVRVLAAIALADAKLELAPDEELAALVKARCDVALPSLQAHIAALRDKDELPALLDKLEAEMRQCMGVAPHLRWPSARASN